MKTTPFLACIAAAAALAPHPARAADEVPDHSLSEWSTLGTTLEGTEIKPDSLKGKVVAIEYWGVF